MSISREEEKHKKNANLPILMQNMQNIQNMHAQKQSTRTETGNYKDTVADLLEDKHFIICIYIYIHIITRPLPATTA